VNSLIAAARGLAAAPGELPIWGTLACSTLVATTMLLAHVEDGRPSAPPRSG